jgi:hypothetical protein
MMVYDIAFSLLICRVNLEDVRVRRTLVLPASVIFFSLFSQPQMPRSRFARIEIYQEAVLIIYHCDTGFGTVMLQSDDRACRGF